MAKTLVVLLLIAGAGYFVYQRMNPATSEEDQLVSNLRDRYAVIVSKFASAAGRSGSLGMDTTYDSETVVVQIQKLRAELAELQRKLTEERATRKAAELSEKIEYFCKKNDIIRP
jgi:predicted Zn-dependent peptidase